jgi:hypothetical protein
MIHLLTFNIWYSNFLLFRLFWMKLVQDINILSIKYMANNALQWSYNITVVMKEKATNFEVNILYGIVHCILQYIVLLCAILKLTLSPERQL